MPRGIPNAKRDDTGMRYTTFHVPLAPNPKHMGTSYMKSESQTLWARNVARRNKTSTEEPLAQPPEQRRGSHVIVIHPGSSWLRIGRASDVNPISLPNVIARKHKPPAPTPTFIERVSRPRKSRPDPKVPTPPHPSEYAVDVSPDDPFDAKIGNITVSLRDRMKFYKLRVTSNAANIASTFNDQFKPEIIPEMNDSFRVDWLQEDQDEKKALVGEQALRLADPQSSNYCVRYPIYGSTFNTRDYPSTQMIVDDIETILFFALKDKLNVGRKDIKEYSVVLVIPDLFERAYIREFVNLLLNTMGFKQLCVQQESLAATYGAGISSACVVDIGAVTTSIACVDEGLVIADSRMSLNVGGDDITEFLYVLLERINFPYRDINLARSYDWDVMEDLKARLCTLAEGDVALNLYDFVVRKPGKPTEKYGLRAYDEIILAPMCLFEPRVIEFDRKRIGMGPISHPNVTEEILESSLEGVTHAMLISTQHLMPPAPLSLQGASADSSAVQTSTSGQAATTTTTTTTTATANPADGDAKQEQQDIVLPAANTSPPPPAVPPATDANSEGTTDVQMEVVDVEAENNTAPSVPPQPAAVQNLNDAVKSYPGHPLAIDIYFEASKLPLDVAIFNSTRAAGGDDKIRKYLQAVLVIGGTALIPGMAHALESRLQAIATPLVPNMEKVQIIPPPKEVDPRVLTWKGAAVLGRMDSVADLWITAADWDILGVRGLKERCFYL